MNDPTAGAISCPATTLAPGATTTCTSSAHVVTQADVDAGSVTNTATAGGKDPHGNPVTSSPASATTPIAQTSTVALTKTASNADVNGDFKIDLGDTVTWRLRVKNTGTTTLTSVSVGDPSAGTATCPAGSLAPGASVDLHRRRPHDLADRCRRRGGHQHGHRDGCGPAGSPGHL